MAPRTDGHDVDSDDARRSRSFPVVAEELREVERHMAEVPPHHAGGASDLAERADRLRRELARLQEGRGGDGA